ncbi:short-chain dehydrogenase TIC 32, chloroplastic-like [Lycium ferocissimum]|uniref:short-chain dehydrogenase TIC 32, chloroplastic-like n=1 Tax=Lycium ferocissimum TaxID=112874 RepID=UPI002815957B|nr:short-chain dehydrogenase TIC 32, chloroplastic-like [Lycium ferocissimum]
MWLFGRKGASGFSTSSTAEQVTHGIDATGLTAIVTGASSGIGAETTRVLAMRGAHVVMAVRNVKSGAEVKENILKEIPHAKIDVMELDLGCMASVRKFASEYNSFGYPLNILINNAGVMAPPFMLSQDNIELQFATNHLGHFLLTNLLLQNLKDTAQTSHKEGRIVNVSSMNHRFTYREGIRFDKINDKDSYSAILAYGQSKLANILHSNELARYFKEEGVEITANSLHPGAINTNLLRHQNLVEGIVNWIGKYFIKDIPQGAATTCYVALHPQVKGISGEYFSDSNIAAPTSQAKDVELAKKLWDFSLNLTKPQ